MAIFSNSSAKSSKKTTPATTTPCQRQRSVSLTGLSATFEPETMGDTISPSHSTSATLNAMEGSSTHDDLPTGRSPPTLLDQKPESMVAESLRMKGELEFTRLLRVDGRFEGELITDKGSLVVGPKGEVIGDLKNMEEVYVEGIVRGNVFAKNVKIKNNGVLLGDVQCLCLTLDPTASIKGIADTATMKERAMSEASPAPPSPSSSTPTTTTAASSATVDDASPAAATTLAAPAALADSSVLSQPSPPTATPTPTT